MLKQLELEVEERERRAMRAEEVHQLLVYREQRRLEVLRQTRELLSMRLAEQQQRRTQRDIEARLRLEALRESQRQRREEAAELIAMRREEEYLRYVHAEMRRQAAILQQRLRAEEARLQVRERERMMCVGGHGSCVCVLSSCRHVCVCGRVCLCVCVSVCLCLVFLWWMQRYRFEEAHQRRVASELRRLLLESFQQWRAEEQRREAMSRNAMDVADLFSAQLREYGKQVAAETAAREMEGICMQAEDAYVHARLPHRLVSAAHTRRVLGCCGYVAAGAGRSTLWKWLPLAPPFIAAKSAAPSPSSGKRRSTWCAPSDAQLRPALLRATILSCRRKPVPSNGTRSDCS